MKLIETIYDEKSEYKKFIKYFKKIGAKSIF